MSPLRLAYLSLSRHQFATFTTVLGIALSVACGGILLRLSQLADSRFSAMGRGGDAIVGAKAGGIEILLGALNGEGDFPDFLPYKLFESLRAEQAVTHGDGVTTKPSYIRNITPFVYFALFRDYRVVGTDETFLRAPRTLAEGKWAAPMGEVVLGAAVARTQRLKVGDNLQVKPWTGGAPLEAAVNLKVTGILAATESQWDRTLFAGVAQAQQVFAQMPYVLEHKSIWGAQVLHYFLVDLEPEGFRELAILINRRTVAQAIRVDEQQQKLRSLSGAGQDVGLFLTAFVILLGGLSVCAMLITRFEGMALQLAVLRGLGYTRRDISRWLVWEGLLLGLLGIAGGILLDAIGFPILRSFLAAALPPPELVASSVIQSALIWVMALVATVAAVVVPVARMARQDTHRALKGL